MNAGLLTNDPLQAADIARCRRKEYNFFMRDPARTLVSASILFLAGNVNCSRTQTVCDEVAASIPFELDLSRELSPEQRATLAQRFENAPEELTGEGNVLFRSERRDWELRMLRENHAKEIAPILVAIDADETLYEGARAEVYSASLHGHEHLYVLALAVLERRVQPDGKNHLAVGEALAAVCESHRR